MAITEISEPIQFRRWFIGLVTDPKPTGVRPGALFFEIKADLTVACYITQDGTNWRTFDIGDDTLAAELAKVPKSDAAVSWNATALAAIQAAASAALIAINNSQRVTKTSTSHLTTGALFNFTGTVGIVSITGRITTETEVAANTCRLSFICDGLAEYFICTAKDLTHLHPGTLLSITGTAADAMIATDVVGALAPGQPSMVVATCITSGTINATFSDSGNRDGAIAWDLLWIPLSATGSVTAT